MFAPKIEESNDSSIIVASQTIQHKTEMDNIVSELKNLTNNGDFKPIYLDKSIEGKEYKKGDIVMLRLSNEVLAQVKIVADRKGYCYRQRVAALTGKNKLFPYCYHVEIIPTKQKYWVQEVSLYPVTRPRPLYGPPKKIVTEKSEVSNTRKKNVHKDFILPTTAIKNISRKPDLNISYESIHVPKSDACLSSSSFEEFMRRGADLIFDNVTKMTANKAKLSANTLKDIEIMKHEKEVVTYLAQCWRQLTVNREEDKPENSIVSPVLRVHVGWCLVCGERTGKLIKCEKCPASFHKNCRVAWPHIINHRKILRLEPTPGTSRDKGPSLVVEEAHVCPACAWGPAITYGDIVWHKLKTFPWWPAKIQKPGNLPSCLVSGKHSLSDWPLQYYGDKRYSWAKTEDLCLLTTQHTLYIDENKPDLQEAVLEAFDDYIVVYLA